MFHSALFSSQQQDRQLDECWEDDKENVPPHEVSARGAIAKLKRLIRPARIDGPAGTSLRRRMAAPLQRPKGSDVMIDLALQLRALFRADRVAVWFCHHLAHAQVSSEEGPVAADCKRRLADPESSARMLKRSKSLPVVSLQPHGSLPPRQPSARKPLAPLSESPSLPSLQQFCTPSLPQPPSQGVSSGSSGLGGKDPHSVIRSLFWVQSHYVSVPCKLTPETYNNIATLTRSLSQPPTRSNLGGGVTAGASCQDDSPSCNSALSSFAALGAAASGALFSSLSQPGHLQQQQQPPALAPPHLPPLAALVPSRPSLAQRRGMRQPLDLLTRQAPVLPTPPGSLDTLRLQQQPQPATAAATAGAGALPPLQPPQLSPISALHAAAAAAHVGHRSLFGVHVIPGGWFNKCRGCGDCTAREKELETVMVPLCHE